MERREMACANKTPRSVLPRGSKLDASGEQASLMPLRVLGSQPWLFQGNKDPTKQRPNEQNVRVLGSWSLAVCTCEVLGFSPPGCYSGEAGGREGHRASIRQGEHAQAAASEKGTECRSRFLATRGKGAEQGAQGCPDVALVLLQAECGL